MILNGNNITKEYTRRGEKFPAVNNADFFAWSGDYTVIFGESGSGKSTLLNALAGISAPTSGCIAIDGQPLYTLNDEDRSKLRNERIGYIPQNAACLPAFTVTENIELAASLYKRRIDKEQIQSLLKKLGIAHLANEYPANLSGGELRRVAIARALVNNPDLIIADELQAISTKTTAARFSAFSEGLQNQAQQSLSPRTTDRHLATVIARTT